MCKEVMLILIHYLLAWVLVGLRTLGMHRSEKGATKSVPTWFLYVVNGLFRLHPDVGACAVIPSHCVKALVVGPYSLGTCLRI